MSVAVVIVLEAAPEGRWEAECTRSREEVGVFIVVIFFSLLYPFGSLVDGDSRVFF